MRLKYGKAHYGRFNGVYAQLTICNKRLRLEAYKRDRYSNAPMYAILFALD